MKVYEVLADWDGTLRSRAYSEGLFLKKSDADNYAGDILQGGKCYGGVSVVERTVS
jgi:hypothetical protein